MGYVANVQIPGSTVVGRLPTQGAKEHFGIVFQKGNPLARCVNRAINACGRTARSRSSRFAGSGRAGAPILK